MCCFFFFVFLEKLNSRNVYNWQIFDPPLQKKKSFVRCSKQTFPKMFLLLLAIIINVSTVKKMTLPQNRYKQQKKLRFQVRPKNVHIWQLIGEKIKHQKRKQKNNIRSPGQQCMSLHGLWSCSSKFVVFTFTDHTFGGGKYQKFVIPP